jgi:glyoxylase-like metal-dependent hydrolase (beta-lactamase superfamily II)
MSIRIECLPSGPFHTNTYLLMSSSSNDAVVVDPSPNSAHELEALLKEHQKTLIAIWITHSHWDHTADCHALLTHRDIPVMVHRFDAENLIHPGSDGIPSWIPIHPLTSATLLNDGDILHVGSSSWKVIHTPGHSPGSVCLYNAKEGFLLSGDTLFKGTMGNISFPTSSPYLMGETLLKLSSLPPTTRVLPGHGPSTTIGNEQAWMVISAQQQL